MWNEVTINEPMKKFPEVGIAEFRFRNAEGVIVRFRNDPKHVYRVKTEDAFQCNQFVASGHVILRMVPLEKMEMIKLQEPEHDAPGYKK